MPKQLVYRDPRLFEPPAPPAASYKLVAGLDLGTSTGVAFTWFQPGRPFVLGECPIVLGLWDLDSESWPMRFLKLRAFMAQLNPDLVVYERVRNTPPQEDLAKANRFTISAIASRIMNAAQLYGGYLATVTGWCAQYDVPCEGVGIADIKKRATGKGNADKESVIGACNAALGTEFDPTTYAATGVDNIADAAWVLILGLEAYCAGIDLTPRPPGKRAARELE